MRGSFVVAASLALAGCFPLPAHIEASPRPFSPDDLSGCWYLSATNFPYWTDGTKTASRQCYTPSGGGPGEARFDDLVAFQNHGEPDSFEGVDYQDPGDPLHFTWRGEGLLALFPTEFYVAWISPDKRTLVVYYSDTLVASAAVDVLTRDPIPESARVDEALDVVRSDPFLRDVGDRYVVLRGAPR